MNPRSSALVRAVRVSVFAAKLLIYFALFKDYSDLCIVIDKVLTL